MVAVGEDEDEVSSYLDARYVSPMEACWRIFEYDLHYQSHTVVRLKVHLPNEQIVVFNEDINLDAAMERAEKTELTEYFVKCSEDIYARSFTYVEFPKDYLWDPTSKEWRKRRNNVKVIARVYSVSPKEGERYYLRLLLHNVPGATSFEHLRTVGNSVCDTFKDACSLLGLLEEDVEWTHCMDEAALWQMPCELYNYS